MPVDPSILTPFQITAAGNLLQNQGLGVNVAFTTAVAKYSSTPLIAPLIATIGASAPLNAQNKAALYTLGSSSVPALSDSVPSAGLANYPGTLMNTLLINLATTYMGSGDLTKFCQGFSTIQGYNGVTNTFVNSAVNSQNYLGGTFTNSNNMVSGGITAVNLCTSAWGSDLAKLGGLINLENLDELGTPWALVQQLAKLGGITPQLALAFTAEGVSLDVVVNLGSTSTTPSDADQKAMYTAMTKITGTNLTQILQVIGVTTPNINTMADLLNPYKIFPNSFQSLTVTDTKGVSQNIYLDAAGTVNNTLVNGLPPLAVSSLS